MQCYAELKRHARSCSITVIVWLHLLSGGHHVGGDRSGSGRCSRRSVDPLLRARQACFDEAIVGAPLGLSTADRNLSRYYCESLGSTSCTSNFGNKQKGTY